MRRETGERSCCEDLRLSRAYAEPAGAILTPALLCLDLFLSWRREQRRARCWEHAGRLSPLPSSAADGGLGAATADDDLLVWPLLAAPAAGGGGSGRGEARLQALAASSSTSELFAVRWRGGRRLRSAQHACLQVHRRASSFPSCSAVCGAVCHRHHRLASPQFIISSKVGLIDFLILVSVFVGASGSRQVVRANFKSST